MSRDRPITLFDLSCESCNPQGHNSKPKFHSHLIRKRLLPSSRLLPRGCVTALLSASSTPFPDVTTRPEGLSPPSAHTRAQMFSDPATAEPPPTLHLLAHQLCSSLLSHPHQSVSPTKTGILLCRSSTRDLSSIWSSARHVSVRKS